MSKTLRWPNFPIFNSVSVVATVLALPAAFAATAPAEKAKVITQNAQWIADERTILAPAKIDAALQTQVNADIEGHIVKIEKVLGTPVKAGEVVLYIENQDPGFTYAKVPVRSPITGVISQMQVSAMTKTQRGEKLFVVMNPKSIKIKSEFAALDVPALKQGLKGVFKLGSQEYPVQISGVSPLVDPRTGTAAAEITFSDLRQAMPVIGSIGQVSFKLSLGQILLVPESALSYLEGKPFVRLLDTDSKVTKKNIELGEQRESQYVVKSGLNPGERVILRASRPVKEGEVAEVEKTDESKSEKAQ